VIRSKFKDEILHEVMHDLIPRSLDEAMQSHSLATVDTPDVKDVSLEEGAPLRFTAEFETVPPLPPLDYASLQLRRPPVTVADEAVARVMERVRERNARFEPIEDRASERGDSLTLDVTRTTLSSPSEEASAELGTSEEQRDVVLEVGGELNPPGFDEQVTGLRPGDERTFTIAFPEDYRFEGLRGAEVEYRVAVKALRRKVLPALDDEFAKDLGLDSLEALRERVRADLQRDAERTQQREMRDDLLRQLATHVTVDVPETLVGREVDRRLEEFVRRLVDQGVDPMKAGIDWEDFRAKQREAALDTVKATLMLDEVARLEAVEVPDEAVEAELKKFAELSGRSVGAVRARLAEDGGLARLRAGLRRDRSVELLMTRATILEV
jgi:trigger factor